MDHLPPDGSTTLVVNSELVATCCRRDFLVQPKRHEEFSEDPVGGYGVEVAPRPSRENEVREILRGSWIKPAVMQLCRIRLAPAGIHSSAGRPERSL